MKLLLTSTGFTTPEIITAAVSLTEKAQHEISIAVINEAHTVLPGDKHWVIDELNRIAQAFPNQVDIISPKNISFDEMKVRLYAADIVYVVGGHTDYEMKIFQETGLVTLLPELLKTKVYVGSSAGSMILGHRAAEGTYKEIYGEDSGFAIHEYLNILPFIFMPHRNSDFFTDCTDTNVTTISANQSVHLISVQDDQALKIINQEHEQVGGPILIAQNGQRMNTLPPLQV